MIDVFSEEELSELGSDILLVGALALIRTQAVEKALVIAESSRHIVLGMEGFVFRENTLLPMLDYVADFSSIGGDRSVRSRESIHAARRALSHWTLAPPYVELTLE